MSLLEKNLLSGFFIAYMAKNLVGFDTFSSILAWISVTAFVVLDSAGERSPDTRAGALTGNAQKALLPLLLLLAFTAIYALNFRAYQDNLRYARLMGNPLALRSPHLAAVLEHPPGNDVQAENAKLAVLDTLITNSRKRRLTSLERKRLERVTEQAELLIDVSLQRQPRNYRVKYNGALLYARTGRYEEALVMFEELTREAPNRTAFWHTLSRLYVQSGQPEQAALALQTAEALNPGWKP